MKKYWITAVFFGIGIAAILCAADPGACIIAKAMNSEDGQKLFTKHCAVCHSDSGTASVITPASKTADDWEKWFQAGTHLGQDLTAIVPGDNLWKIRDYCLEQAPEKGPEVEPDKAPENAPETAMPDSAPAS